MRATPTGIHKVLPATSGDYRTIMRLSQFGRPDHKTGSHDIIRQTAAFMAPLPSQY